MKWIKFTNANLITFITVVLCSLSILFTSSSAKAERYVVQIAATKDFLDIPKYAEKVGVTDRIIEIKDEDWIRYVVGDFETFEMASKYAVKLVKTTKLTGAFPRIIKGGVIHPESIQEEVSDLQIQSEIVLDTVKEEDGKNKESVVVKSIVRPELSNAKSGNSDSFKRYNSEAKEEIRYVFSYRNRFLLMLFGEEKVLEQKRKMLDYTDRHFSSSRKLFYKRLIDHVYNYPLVIVFAGLICIFILHVFFLVIFLSCSSRLKNNNERYNQIYRGLYENVILAFLFGEIEWETFQAKLKKIKRRKNRKILTSILLNFHHNLKGGVEKLLPEIYFKLDLQNDSIKKVNSPFFFKKVEGLHELTYLYPEGASQILPDLLKHSHESVRGEAQKSYILLHPDKPFDFLRFLNKPFSRWTQLSAFYLLRLPQLTIPSFSKYLLSSHNGVRVFCLQMINYFQQLENVTLIFNLLESRIELTRFLAYKAINNLRLYDGRVLIKKEYRDETEKNKLEILKALRNIGTDEDIDFLEIIFRSESIALRIEACRTMYYMSSESKERLVNVSEKAVPELELYIAHITDKRNG